MATHTVTGAVQIGTGRSVANIDIVQMTTTNQSGVEGEKERGMAPLGTKVVRHAVYTVPFFVDPLQMAKTNATAEDLKIFASILPHIFNLNMARTRPEVELRHAWWVEHTGPLGSVPTHVVLDTLTPKVKTESPASWADYEDGDDAQLSEDKRVKSVTDLLNGVPEFSNPMNRVTGLLVVEATFSNINGDPDAESLPRSVDGIGIVSDVSIKAKVRKVAANPEFFKAAGIKYDQSRMGILEQRGRDRNEIKNLKPEEFLGRFWDARLFGSTFLEAEEKGDAPETKPKKKTTAA
jgi:CRISPR/Cas system type I-B associated protein Csh2 (Cas7 group RAMP superfamily)